MNALEIYTCNTPEEVLQYKLVKMVTPFVVTYCGKYKVNIRPIASEELNQKRTWKKTDKVNTQADTCFQHLLYSYHFPNMSQLTLADSIYFESPKQWKGVLNNTCLYFSHYRFSVSNRIKTWSTILQSITWVSLMEEGPHSNHCTINGNIKNPLVVAILCYK
ncbi:hypothetical protein BDB01DRAFT_831725 [Pilobolus umbonatus]|nr:hypothetical protein BDB01DRAFT_831725 [Pilobolus umbonatus]